MCDQLLLVMKACFTLSTHPYCDLYLERNRRYTSIYPLLPPSINFFISTILLNDDNMSKCLNKTSQCFKILLNNSSELNGKLNSCISYARKVSDCVSI